VKRLVAARAQDRLAQPLQAEDEQERADDEPQRAERDHREGGSERDHDHGEHERRRSEPREGRAPAAGEAGGEDDRQRLHEFDAARKERGQDEECVAGAHQRPQ
jgi:hypothetical protein